MAKEKVRVCKNCGNPLSVNAVICPACGAKIKKPVYKRWWFWLIIAVIVIGLVSGGSGGSKQEEQSPSTVVEENVPAEESSPVETEEPSAEEGESETSVETETEEEPSAVEPDVDAEGVGAEFKAAMDSYEAFFDEYVAFMKKYEESNGSDLSLLTDYASYMSKYADMMADLEAWNSEDMSTEEAAYYIEVQSRITQKLLEVAE